MVVVVLLKNDWPEHFKCSIQMAERYLDLLLKKEDFANEACG